MTGSVEQAMDALALNDTANSNESTDTAKPQESTEDIEALYGFSDAQLDGFITEDRLVRS